VAPPPLNFQRKHPAPKMAIKATSMGSEQSRGVLLKFGGNKIPATAEATTAERRNSVQKLGSG